MSVYTKTGDDGKTSLYLNTRVYKSSKVINLIGKIDELNSYLGLISGFDWLQRDLFLINSIISGAKLKFPKKKTKRLETKIDFMEQKLPVLKNFLIYSGSKKAREIYFARSLVRSSERNLVSFLKEFNKLNKNEKGKVEADLENIKNILIFLNRLSDYLYTLGRYTNFKKKIREKIWK